MLIPRSNPADFINISFRIFTSLLFLPTLKTFPYPSNSAADKVASNSVSDSPKMRSNSMLYPEYSPLKTDRFK